MKWMQFFTPAKSMKPTDAQSYIRDHSREDVVILDVRQPSEYSQEHLPGSTLIPLPELGDRLEELNPEKPILVY